jgi:hypothetical protein
MQSRATPARMVPRQGRSCLNSGARQPTLPLVGRRDLPGGSVPYSQASPKRPLLDKLLILDHDDASAGMLARWVRAARWEPIVAKTLDLDQLTRLADGCGGAILSVDAPDGSGWQMIGACRAVFPAIPLAALGDRCLSSAIHAQALGYHYIFRPASFSSVFRFADGIARHQRDTLFLTT